MRSLVRRPLKLTRQNGELRLTLVDRRRPPEVIEAERLKQLRVSLRLELQERLDAHEGLAATAVMRHLAFVHHKLSRRGWKAVAALSSRVLGRALVQAQMLASHQASTTLTQLIQQLQRLQLAAAQREERQTRIANVNTGPALEVSETSLDDYQTTERGWLDTVSSHR